jgi:DUF1009 family protein
MTPLFDELPRPIRDRLNYGDITMDEAGVAKLHQIISSAKTAGKDEEFVVSVVLEFLSKREAEILKECI